MFDFGDELTVEGNRIPWLLWIQIMVLFLLLIILFCLSFFPSDLSDTASPSSSASSSAVGVFMPLNSHLNKQTSKHNDHTATATNCLQHSQLRKCFKNSEFARFLGPRQQAFSSIWRACERNGVYVCNIDCIVRNPTVLRFFAGTSEQKYKRRNSNKHRQNHSK